VIRYSDFDSVEEYVAAARTFADYDVGETYGTSGRTVTDADIRLFNGATDGSHPNHVDREYAAGHPLVDDVVAQGVLTLGILDGFVVDEISAEAAFPLNYGYDRVRFLEPVYVGDTVTATIEIADTERTDETWGVLDLDVTVHNQDGDVVLAARNKILVVTEDATAADLG